MRSRRVDEPGREGLGQRALRVCPGLLGSKQPQHRASQSSEWGEEMQIESPRARFSPGRPSVLAVVWRGHFTTQHPGGASGKEPACQCRRLRDPWVRKIPWSRK